MTRIDEALKAVRQMTSMSPQIGLILGSGLGPLADTIDPEAILPYKELPHMVPCTNPFHRGRLVLGRLHGTEIACMQGRVHGYEGYGARDIVFPVRLLAALGVRTLITTNASGAINEGFAAGEFVAISDHINLTGENPLAGPFNLPGEVDHLIATDMTYAYSRRLRELAHEVASEHGIGLHDGVYLCVQGPSFETPAEIRAFRALGADLVGMSSVLEVICAQSLGVDVLALSLVTNMAAGVLDQPLTAREVYETGSARIPAMRELVSGVIEELGRE